METKGSIVDTLNEKELASLEANFVINEKCCESIEYFSQIVHTGWAKFIIPNDVYYDQWDHFTYIIRAFPGWLLMHLMWMKMICHSQWDDLGFVYCLQPMHIIICHSSRIGMSRNISMEMWNENVMNILFEVISSPRPFNTVNINGELRVCWIVYMMTDWVENENKFETTW